MKPQLKFSGLICPVFTSFQDDKNRMVNYEKIDEYAKMLKTKGVDAVLVNSAIGEGVCLRLDERKRLCEEWLSACRKHQLMCMVQIGGACIAEVYELAEHAAKIRVDACICLPDMFYRPQCEEDLVQYLRDVAQRCPSLPLLYCHIPVLTRVKLSMPRLCDLAERDIPNFNGVQYCSSKLDDCCACVRPNRTIILGCDSILLAGLAQNIDAHCLTILNHYPELVIEIRDHVRNNKLQDAMAAHNKLMQRIHECCKRGQDFVLVMKNLFKKVQPSLIVGPCRKPHVNVINREC